MVRGKYKHIGLWLLFAAFLGCLSGYHYMTLLPQEGKKPESVIVLPSGQKIVRPEMRVYLREQYSICQKHSLPCSIEYLMEAAAREELNNITESELQVKYPAAAGWNIIWQEKSIILEQVHPGLCPEHKKRWHLGLDETGEKVAVYLGPSQIGQEGGMVKATDIEVKRLPADLQRQIKEGSMEFLDWDDLIGTLDSLDE